MNFTPVVRTSNSIPRSLLEFSKERKIDVKLLDFELISFETLIKRELDPEYTVVEDPSSISQEDLLDNSFTIIQEYSIKIMPLTKSRLHPKIKLSIAANKTKTKAILKILKGSIFTKSETLFKDLKHQIYEKKLRSGLFIGIFEPNLDAQLRKLLKIVPYDKELPKDLQMSVALGVMPIASTNASLEKIFELKEKESKSIIDGVDVGELILKFIKPKEGKDGRACNGKYIQVSPSKVINLQPKSDEVTILEKETPEHIEYYAKETGYVLLKDGQVSISKQLKLDGANFKSSANIDGGDGDKDISVHIAHSKTHSEDAVGSGVNIDVKELNIDGSVGSNVKISTQELNIDAQTHRNSKMEVANNANIKLHRGDLVAKDAKIDVLETGKITAHKSIHIKKMLGGEAIAPIVRVDELLSNSTIIASELIEITSLNGKDNKLIINPDAIESYHKDLEKIKEQIKESQNALNETKASLDAKIKAQSEKVDRMKVFQKRILAAQKAGKNPMKQDVIRVREFKSDSLKLKEQEENIALQEKELSKLNNELEKMYELEYHAKIVCHTSYDGHTKVIFIDLKTKEEIMHVPEGKVETISLIKNSEGENSIKLD